MVIVLEPLLSEIVIDAGGIPLTAKELREFVDATVEEFGVKIVYGSDILLRDDWIFDVLTNKEYVQTLKQYY